MPRYEVAWSYGGYTVVEASDENDAREKFHALDHSRIVREMAFEGAIELDVVNVAPAEEG